MPRFGIPWQVVVGQVCGWVLLGVVLFCPGGGGGVLLLVMGWKW